jgi:hypothetical protein
MGSRGWTRFAAGAVLSGLIAVAVFGVASSSAPAGNRNPVVQLVAVPGPSEVTYGKNVAYSASIVNTGNSNFTKLQFADKIPTTIVNGSPVQATLKYASCQGALTATEFVCNEITLVAGATAKVTIVWATPPAGASSDCPTSTPSCMTNSGVWSIKEGTGNPGSSGPDTFPVGPVVTSLLVVPDQRKAGGYPITACTSPSNSLLETFPVGTGNPLQTKVCSTSLPVGDSLNPGLATAINERDRTASDPGVTQVSDICIAAPNNDCAPGYTPFVSPTFSFFSFVIDNTTLLNNETIDQVFEDGALVSSNQTADPHVVSITVDKKKKITTVIVASKTNGGWAFG